MRLTIEVSPEIEGKLRSVEQKVNKNLINTIEKELKSPVTIEQVAGALVTMGLSGAIKDRTVIEVVKARQQLGIYTL